MRHKYLSKSQKQTKKKGELLAKKLLKTKIRKTALVLGLEGDLGGGKTTFLQGFAGGLGIKQKILSPTFIIMKKFQIPPKKSTLPGRQQVVCGTGDRGRAKSKLQINFKIQSPEFKNFYHIDCYRIQKPKELSTIGFKEIIFQSKNIIAVEWAERVKKIMPQKTLWINFKFINQNTREITICFQKRNI